MLDMPSRIIWIISFTAPAVDLSPSCDAGANLAASRVSIYDGFKRFLSTGYSGQDVKPRPNKGQVALQHVDELRQLVDRLTPDAAAYPCDSGITACDQATRCWITICGSPGSKLPHVGRLMVVAVARLFKQDRTGAV